MTLFSHFTDMNSTKPWDSCCVHRAPPSLDVCSQLGLMYKTHQLIAVVIADCCVLLIMSPKLSWLQALEGLRVILGVRPQTLSTMVPKLLRGTLTSTNCRALGSLAEVAGPAIAPHLSHIFPPMLRLASQAEGSSPATAAAKDCLDKVCIPLSTLSSDCLKPVCRITVKSQSVHSHCSGQTNDRLIFVRDERTGQHCQALHACLTAQVKGASL